MIEINDKAINDAVTVPLVLITPELAAQILALDFKYQAEMPTELVTKAWYVNTQHRKSQAHD